MYSRFIGHGRAITALSLLLGPAPAFAGTCLGESDLASGVLANQTVTLNPGGGSNVPLDEALVVFTNGPGSEPATVSVCQVAGDPHPGALGYISFGGALTLEVTFENNIPDNEDTFLARVMMPFDNADLPPEAALGPEANEMTFFNPAGAWVLAVSGNTINSPGFAEAVGDRFTVVGPTPPASFSNQPGDYGIYWNPGTMRGFVWANVDHATDFSPGAPLCWSDINGNGVVDTVDILDILANIDQPCDDPPIGCPGDIFFDGVIDFRDLAQALAFLGTNCFLVPDSASILHSIQAVDNSPGAPDFPPGFTYDTWDVRVTMVPDNIGDWWTTTEAIAAIDDFYGGITFFQHGFGTCGPPSSDLCPLFPALEFDTFVVEATPSVCTPGPTSSAVFSCSPASTQVMAKWFDPADVPPPGPGSPPFIIARFTYQVPQPDPCLGCHLDLEVIPSGSGITNDPILGTITGKTTHRLGLSNLIPFSFDLIDRCAADTNDDGTVNVIDFLEVLGAWGPNPVSKPADLDRNGVVDVVDFLNVLARWGPC